MWQLWQKATPWHEVQANESFDAGILCSEALNDGEWSAGSLLKFAG
jgi:hypothetical protein